MTEKREGLDADRVEDEAPPRSDQKHKGPLVGGADAPPMPERIDEHVPEPGHRGSVEVPEREWESHNKRRDTARGHLDEDAPTE